MPKAKKSSKSVAATKSTKAKKPKAKKTTSAAKKSRTEEFSVSGDRVLSTVKRLVREGNARKIAIKNQKGNTLIEIPLTIGAVGAALLPVWAAVGAIAALVSKMTIAVERDNTKPKKKPKA